ncbi:MAG TPA: hypothetical protein VGK20_18815 [Candidatus Binatia bacterium]|jgi:hypothetical protein
MEEATERGGRFQSDERLLDVFDPDIILPAQHFAAIQRKKFPSGEHRLLIALIQDAIECFQKHMHARDAKRRQLFLDAQGWIGSDDDRAVFSFNNVCMMLGMNPDYVRQGLEQWCEKSNEIQRGRRRTANERPTARIVPAQGCDGADLADALLASADSAA